MQKHEFEEAKKSYRKIASKVLQSKSLQPGSESRLMGSIKTTSQSFVHETGMIRLQDIDGIGPNREKKLASIGIWTPGDLYDEYKSGHLEELIALSKSDNGFTPSVIAKAIASAPKLPEEDLGNGFEKVILIDGSEKLVPVNEIFGMFQKEVKGKSLIPKEKAIRDMLTVSQEAVLMNRFKNSNSVSGIRKVLEDAKKTFKSAGITPRPFAISKSGISSGRRINEIKEYLEKMGLDGREDVLLTLEERGSYLTHEVKNKICASAKEPARCVTTVGLKEIAPLGKKTLIRQKILSLVKADLRTNAANKISGTPKKDTLLERGKTTFQKLKLDADQLADIASDMIRDGLLKPVTNIKTDRLYPTDKVIQEEIRKSQSVLIGKTSNPRIADYLDFMHMTPKESKANYNKRLMNKAGKAVYELKTITRDRMNLKVPIRVTEFDKDAAKAAEILGFNIKTGFAPVGYEYKKSEVADKYNTFNVFIRPPSETVNKTYKANAVINKPESLIFGFDFSSGFEQNVGMTNVLKEDLSYVSTICPFEPDIKIQRSKALAQGLAATTDTIKQRKISGVTESGDGVLTAIYKIAQTLDPKVLGKDLKTPTWKIDHLGSKINRVLSSGSVARTMNSTRDKVRRGVPIKNFTSDEKVLKPIVEMDNSYGVLGVIKAMKESETTAKKLKDKQLEKAGNYSRRRRVGCTITEQVKIDPDKKIFVKIPKSSQAGRDLMNVLSIACPTMEDSCILDNLKFHQNLTDNIGVSTYKEPILTKKVRQLNSTSLDNKDLDRAITIIRNKALNSGETFVGGKKEIKRILTNIEKGSAKDLDLGKWEFLDKI